MEGRTQTRSIEELRCPITSEIFYDPVTTDCNHSFEKDAIIDWLYQHKKPKCPCCRKRISESSLTSNPKLKAEVAQYLIEDPDSIVEQYFQEKLVLRLIKSDPEKHIHRMRKAVELFKARPDRVNSCLAKGRTVLHIATKAKNFFLVKELLRIEGIDIDAKVLNVQNAEQSEIGKTALHFAAFIKNGFILEQLLEKGAKANIPCGDGSTPILIAAKANYEKNVMLLLNASEDLLINQRGNLGRTALHYGVLNNFKRSTFSKLLSVECLDVNVRDSLGETPLYVAARKGNFEKVRALLKMPEIDVEALKTQRTRKRSAMQIAAKKGQIEIVALFTTAETQFSLLKNKLDRDIPDIHAAALVLTEIYNNHGADQLSKYLATLNESHEKFYHQLCIHLMPNIIEKVLKQNDLKLIVILVEEFLRKNKENINKPLINGKPLLYVTILANHRELMDDLLQIESIDCNARCQNGLTPLHVAAANPDPTILQSLLKNRKLKTDVVSDDGITPLMEAAYSNQPTNVRMLVEHGHFNINQIAYDGRTALHDAVERCDIETVNLLLTVDGCEVNLKDQEGESPIFIAAKIGDEEKVRALLKVPGIDLIAMRHHDGKSPFQIAKENGHRHIVKLLREPESQFIYAKNALSQNNVALAVECLATIYHNNEKDKLHFYLSHLHHLEEKNLSVSEKLFQEVCQNLLPKIVERAIENDDIELLLSLLREAKTVINEPLVKDNCILHLAVKKGKQELLRALLSCDGIDVNAKKESGATALNLAACRSDSSIVRLLLDAGARADIASRNGVTPLVNAAFSNQPENVSLFIEHGDCDINQVAFDGRTALHEVVEHCDVEILNLLLAQEDCAVNIKDKDGESPLFIAARIGDKAKVLALLKRGDIDVDAFRKPGDGKSASDIAKANRELEILNLLLSYKLIVQLLNNRMPDKVDLHCLTQTDGNDLSVIFSSLELNYPQQDCHRVLYLIDQIKKFSRTNKASIDPDSSLNVTQKLEELNQLFTLVTNSNNKNKYNWQGKIRQKGFKFFEQSLADLDREQQIQQLEWAREQPFIAEHRSSIFRIGRTDAKKMVDEMLTEKKGFKL